MVITLVQCKKFEHHNLLSVLSTSFLDHNSHNSLHLHLEKWHKPLLQSQNTATSKLGSHQDFFSSHQWRLDWQEFYQVTCLQNGTQIYQSPKIIYKKRILQKKKIWEQTKHGEHSLASSEQLKYFFFCNKFIIQLL